jgi:putative transposase
MGRPPRLTLDNYIGIRQHFVTLCTHRRSRVFESAQEVELTWLHFLQQGTVEGIEITAYCFMPDHLHFLLTGQNPVSDAHRFVCRAKQHSAYAFRRRSGERLWQEGYFDRVLRNEGTTAGVIRYIIDNPVRARLVESPGDYPHWGSSVWRREEILEFVRDVCVCRP